MRSKYLKALLPILAITILGHADYACDKAKNTLDTNEPITQTKEESLFIQYHNRVILFDPFHQGYERIKPNAFYAGVEGYLASALNQSHDSSLMDIEWRMGYNFFFNDRDHLTPFAGIGYVQDFTRHHHHTKHKPGVFYGAVGFLYDHEFNTIFNLGLNGKFLVGGPATDKHYNWGSAVVGIDIALPITFRFGHKRHWDYRIEPFNMYLHGTKNSENYFGFRNSLGYRF